MLAKRLCAAVATSIPFAEAVAQGGRYEIFPEPSVRQAERYRINSVYVVDKKESQFWICTPATNIFRADVIKGSASGCPLK
jgi:hypothetical protein